MAAAPSAKPVPGDFTTAEDIDDLLFAFERAKPGTGVEGTAPVCRGEFCDEGAHRFVLDATVSRVSILGTAPVKGVQVYLAGPTGKPARLSRTGIGKATSIPLPGAQGSYQWESEQTISVTLRAAGAKLWTGQWQLAFVSPSASSGHSRTRIEVTGDLRPVLDGADAHRQIRQGGPVPLSVGVERATGARIGTKDVLGSLDLTAELITGNGDERQLGRIGKDGLGRTIPLDTDALPLGPATLRLTLQVTTAGTTAGKRAVPGTELAPVVREYPVSILPPPSFPTVPEILDFGVLDGTAEATGALVVTGPGCAWLKPDGIVVDTAPEESGTVNLGAGHGDQVSCLSVGPGQTAALDVRLGLQAAGNGMASGTLTIGIASADDPGQTREVPVPFTAELRKPLNQVNYWSALLVAVLLGVGLPLGIVYLIKYLLNSKIPAGALHAVSCDVELADGGLLRDGEPLSVSERELAKLVDIPPGGTRRLQVGGFELVSRLGWSPFGAAQVEVRTPGAEAGSSYRLSPSSGRTWLPLAITDSWVVTQPASGPSRLLMLIGGATARTPDRLRNYLSEVQAGVPTVLGRTAAPNSPGATSGDPWGEPAQRAGSGGFEESSDLWSEPMRPGGTRGPAGSARGAAREPDLFDDDDPFA